MIWVIEAKALPGYRLWLRFFDGSAGDVDLKDSIETDTRSIVSELRNPETFTAIRVEMDTVVWANGFDLALEFLYAKAPAHAPALMPRLT